MLMRMRLLTTLILSICITSAYADTTPSNTGVIHFTGEIINPSCTIDTSDGEDKVPLGSYPTSDFTAANVGHETTAMPFTVTLNDCPPSTTGLENIHLELSGTEVSGHDDLLAVSQITTSGDSVVVPATNIGIAVSIDDGHETPLKFGDSGDLIQIPLAATAGTPITQDFIARYKSYSSPVAAGPADADMTITILYR